MLRYVVEVLKKSELFRISGRIFSMVASDPLFFDLGMAVEL